MRNLTYQSRGRRAHENMTFGKWWRSQDTIDRGTYARVGFWRPSSTTWIVWSATYGFHPPWGFFNYWVPVKDVARITEVRGSEPVFLGTMVALSTFHMCGRGLSVWPDFGGSDFVAFHLFLVDREQYTLGAKDNLRLRKFTPHEEQSHLALGSHAAGTGS